MNRIFFAAIFLFAGLQLHSQLAFRGGLNYSNVSVDPGGVDFGSDSKIGYHLGLQGHLALAGTHIRPALLYNVKGGRVEANGAAQNTSLHYLEVPVDLALKFGGEKLAIIIEGGPYFGYLLNTSSGFANNLKDRLNKSDWGINFGAVIELNGLGIGANYSNSLGNISKEDQLGQAFKTTNGNLSLYGYMKF